MYRFKGFVGIKSLISNVANTTASVGELSAYASTFAKDVRQYVSTNTDVVLYGFSSKSSLTGTITAPTVVLVKASEIADWVVTRQKAISSVETREEFKSALVAEFGNNTVNIEIGDMVIGGNGKLYPTYVTWSNVDYIADTNQNHIWFSDTTFRQQYDEYDIVVVPPLPALDSFFSPYNEVLAQLGARTYLQTIEAIQAARGGYPETILTAEEYTFQNTGNASVNYKTNWSFLIYGPKGNDADLIKAALIDYITTASNRSISLWRVIFPDIFKTTEFSIIPNWHHYAVEEMVLTSGIYSPLRNLRSQLDYLKRSLPDYSATHIENHASMMGYPYKSITLAVVGSLDNRDNKFALTDFFPDIIAVSSTSSDFGRMSAGTQDFMLKIAEMMILAEKMTDFSDIPTFYKKTTRNGILYLSMVYANVRYLIASKLTTPAL